MYRYLAIALSLASALISKADELVLKNGDRVSGKVQISTDFISLHSDVLGNLKVPVTELKTITFEKPVSLPITGSSFNALSISFNNDNALIEIEGGEKIQLSASTVKASLFAVSATPQLSEQNSDIPAASWNAGFTTGFTAARGNKSIDNLNFSVSTSRSSDRSRVSLSLNSLFTQTGTVGQPGTRTNVIRSGARYEHNVTPSVFTFGMTNFDVDQQQQLDLRSVVGAGLGCRIAEGPGATLDVFGGTSFNREAFSSAENRVSGEFLTGQSLTYKPAEQVVFSERFTIYPNFTSPGEFRFTFDSTALMKLNKWLGWETKLNQVFLSNPPLLAQRNDVIITTGLRLTYDRNGAKFNPRSSVGPFDDKKR